MKKFAIHLVMVSLCLFFSTGAWAAYLSFNPTATRVSLDDALTVDVWINGLDSSDGLAAFSTDISYDPSILDFTAYTLGDSLGMIDAGEAEDWSFGDMGGFIHLSELSWLWDFSFQTDSFVLASLSFIGRSIGSSELHFSGLDFGDAWGSAIAVSGYGGTVEVAPVPEPASILLMGIGLLLFCFFQKRFREKSHLLK